ncbi:hypothetical protein DHODJN_12945 [Methylorubrum extorquens]
MKVRSLSTMSYLCLSSRDLVHALVQLMSRVPSHPRPRHRHVPRYGHFHLGRTKLFPE